MRQSAGLLRINTVLADAGFDSEENHRIGREELGLQQVVINLNPRNLGRRWRRGDYRRALRRAFPKQLYRRSTLAACTVQRAACIC